MDMDVFAEKICATVKEKLGEGYKVVAKEVKKNNGVLMKGLLIFSQGQEMTPTIYLESFLEAYESGVPFEAIVDRVAAVYRKDSGKTGSINMDFFRDYEEVKHRVCYRLVGRKDNEDLLQDIPYMEFLDLAICFYYHYKREGIGEGIITIHNSHMEMWGVTIEELFRQAQINTPRLLPWEYSTVEDILREIMNMEEEIPFDTEDVSPDKVLMRVLGNVGRVQGAACILYPGLLDEIAEREGAFMSSPALSMKSLYCRIMGRVPRRH